MSKIKDAVRIMQVSRKSTEKAPLVAQEVPKREDSQRAASTTSAAPNGQGETSKRRRIVSSGPVPASTDVTFVDIEALRDAGLIAPPDQERKVAELTDLIMKESSRLRLLKIEEERLRSAYDWQQRQVRASVETIQRLHAALEEAKE